MADRTTKWKANERNNAVVPPVKVAEVERESAAPEPIAALASAEDYLPVDAEGNEKEDGNKRLLILITDEGTRLQPVRWYNMSKVEAGLVIAEVNKIIALEIAQGIMARETEASAEIDKQVMIALRRAGLLTEEPRREIEEVG